MTEKYMYVDNGEYWSIIDKDTLTKSFESIKEELKKDGYMEDFTMEEIDEIAEEQFDEYLEDKGMYGEVICKRLNEQDKLINEVHELSAEILSLPRINLQEISRMVREIYTKTKKGDD